MGRVIAFRPRPKAASERGNAQQHDAQILFFLGVRYARTDDGCAGPLTTPDAESQRAPRGGGKRKRRVRAQL